MIIEGELQNKIVDVVNTSTKPHTVYEIVQKLRDAGEEKDIGTEIHKLVKAKVLNIEKDNTVTINNVEIKPKLTPEMLDTLSALPLSSFLRPAPHPACFDEDKNPAVHSPSHYTRGGIETIDFIEAKGLNFHLGNVVKYVSRAGFKEDATIQDLEKAQWYLTREITRLKGK